MNKSTWKKIKRGVPVIFFTASSLSVFPPSVKRHTCLFYRFTVPTFLLRFSFRMSDPSAEHIVNFTKRRPVERRTDPSGSLALGPISTME